MRSWHSGYDFAKFAASVGNVVTRGLLSAEYTVDFLPKVKLEIVVSDDDVSTGDRKRSPVARTGNIGDGKIFVTPLAEVIRIRTGETGGEAL